VTPVPDTEGLEPIAIIGMAARVPGARDLTEFWRNLLDGKESVTQFSREEQLARGASESDLDDPSWVPAAPVLEHYDYFDAGLFGMTAHEAALTDPQHKVFLEVAHSALEDSGYDPARCAGQTGVYAGSGANTYHWYNLATNPKVWEMEHGGLTLAVGNSPSYLSTTLSYKFDLRGPSMTVHTACSTSLVAIHLACEALRNGECDLALAGGVSIELPHGVGYAGSDGFLSADGHCRPFDAGATGTLWGSGAGVVVLKRLSAALEDGDTIRSVILGNAVNNDGAGKVGFSAPSVAGQAEVVAQALDAAGIDPRTIGYVEAHGTGTALGDPIEVTALSSVYGQETADRGWCGIGSVKSNIGHLSQAAGVIGVIKSTLALENGLIPPTINYEEANPAIDFERTPFHVVTSVSKWDSYGSPRRAGVSSFGIGGTNAHLILQEPPRPVRPPAPARTHHLLRLSAATPEALRESGKRLAAHLGNATADLAGVAYTLGAGRAQRVHRGFVVAGDPADAAKALRDKKRLRTGEADGKPSVAFLFSGQGAQYPGMGAQLYQSVPAFAAALDQCAGLLQPELGADLRDIMFLTGPEAEERLRQTRFTQPALFALEYSLAQAWASWGIRPAAMIGHSIGEYVAATLAGVFSLESALRVVAARGRLMQDLPAGAMLALQLDESAAATQLPPGISIATVNGPGTCVVAGPAEAIADFAAELKANGVGSRQLRTSHAFHSAAMDPILPAFTELVASAGLNRPRQPFISNVTGDWITPQQAADPRYWAAHLRQPVRFGDGLAVLLNGPAVQKGPAGLSGPAGLNGRARHLLVECGPGRQLAGLARLQTGKAMAPLHSLPGPGERDGDLETILAAAGQLWVAGCPLDPENLDGPAHRVPLPAYPYERRRHWIDPPGETAARAATAPKRAKELELAEWFAVPVWQQIAPEPATPLDGHCVVFTAGARGDAIAAQLRQAGAEVTEVRPDSLTSYESLVRQEETHFIHAWTLDPSPALAHAEPSPVSADAELPDLADPESSPARAGTESLPTLADSELLLEKRSSIATMASGEAAQAQELGYFSALALVQAIAAADATTQTRLTLLSHGTEDVLGGDLTSPEFATLAGLARVIPLELPGLVVRRIDLDDRVPAASAVSEISLIGSAHAEVALRGNRRWVKAFEQLQLPPAEPAVLRQGGRYLITGGLGGIGITLAEDLGTRLAAKLVLIGRSALPAHPEQGRDRRAAEAISRIEAAGGEVLVLAADVTSPQALEEVKTAAVARFGGIDGIIHAAGLAGGAMAEVADPAVSRRVFAPKIEGTLALHRAFGDLPLDFVALCSSVTGIAGGLGQADYCAANAFLDAYARSGLWGAPVISMNWGGWLEVGMAAETAAPAALRTLGEAGQRQLAHPMLTAGDGTVWHGRLSPGTHWLLGEHHVGGVPVVPGTGHLEAARAAVAASLPAPGADWALELRDVVFLRPFKVAEGTVAGYAVEVIPAGQETSFQIIAPTDGTVYVQGSAAWVADRPATVDLAALLSRMKPVPMAAKGHGGTVGEPHGGTADGPDGGTAAGIHSGISHSGVVVLGPRWQAQSAAYVGDAEELALIEAPAEVAAELDQWVLHPALLDVATSFGSSRGDGQYLPLSYGRIRVSRPLPGRFYSHLRYRDSDGSEIVTADLSLIDGDGAIVAEIEDFILRRIDGNAVTASLTASASPIAGTSSTVGTTPAGATPGPENASRGLPAKTVRAQGISPADGAEAFRRAIEANVGPQLVIHTRTVVELMESVRRRDVSAIAEADTPQGVPAVRDGDPVAPRSELEAAIAEVWSRILGVPNVGVDDDFFSLGGNSLVAVQLIAQTRKATGVRIPMRSLFDAPTVAQLAAIAEQLRATATSTSGAAGSGEPAQPAPPAAIPRLPR
jgi:phthiocerol/phenolphthiocerol synthesis type-I polyketide synthase E